MIVCDFTKISPVSIQLDISEASLKVTQLNA